MADSTLTGALDYAFAALQAAVAETAAANRQPTAAGLKPILQRRTNRQFSETRLGFANFRAFLDAAEQAGRVRLASGSQDVLVLPADEGGPTPSPSRPPSEPESTLLRSDFWRAFNDTRTAWQHWYDKAADKVVTLPIQETPLDSPEVVKLREETNGDTDRYVRIEPVPAATQVDWMRQFLDQRGDAPEISLLRSALETSRPIASFLRSVKSTPLAGEWHRRRIERTMAAAESWMEQNGLNVKLRRARLHPTRLDVPLRPTGLADETQIRDKIKSAVDRMPLHELLRLAIPVEYVL